LKGLPLNNAVNMMRGKPGTSLTLTIVRQGVEKPLKVKLKRAIITIKSVRARTLDPGYGYLRISQFQTHTANELQNAVARLKKDNGGKLKGVVLDLRNNPGGVLSAAVAVSDMFLSKGLIVYTKGRVKDSAMRFTAKPNDVLHKAPIVVLVNGGTASASEIVAGALQDNKRALIMGQQTFGKGSVQTILPMPDDTALKLTTARYYTPSGRSIQASGITPDIVIPEVKVEKVSPEIATVKEVNLSGHLANPNAPAPAKKENTSIAEPSPTKDYALSQALNVLKALAIFRNGAG
jgi:carboxyl-terminal processing protease